MSASPAAAATDNWNDHTAATLDWFAPGSWSLGHPPLIGDDAFLDNHANAEVNASAVFLTLTLTNDSRVTVLEGGSLGSGSISLDANSNIYFNNTSTLSINNAFSGAGQINFFDLGTFTLNAASTNTGMYLVDGGTIKAGGTNFFSANAYYNLRDLNSAATLDLNGFDQTIKQLGGNIDASLVLGNKKLTLGGGIFTGTSDFKGLITGSALSEIVVDTGTFVVENENVGFLGKATVHTGAVMQIGIGGNPASLGGLIVNNGLLLLENGGAGVLTVANNISGAGEVQVSNFGDVVLSGSNTYSGDTTFNIAAPGVLKAGSNTGFSANSIVQMISGATLDLNGFNSTVGGLNGTGGTVNVGNAWLFVQAASDSSYGGAITGTSSNPLTKSGSGTFTLLAGASINYTGQTLVNRGMLVVDADISSSSDVSVGNNATLSGIGTVPSVTIGSGGSLNPGNNPTPGTLHIAGDLTFITGSHMLVYVNGSDASLAEVTGAVDLRDAPELSFDFTSPTAGVYTIMTATGGFDGQFDSNVFYGSLSGLTPTLIYQTNSILLQLTGPGFNWTGAVSTDWNDDDNWTTDKPGSGETGEFTVASNETVDIDQNTTVGGMHFTGDAFVFNVDGTSGNVTFTLDGTGIDNCACAVQTINLNGSAATTASLTLQNSATLGDTHVNVGDGANITFADSASPGSATIVLGSTAVATAMVIFNGSSAAGTATIDQIANFHQNFDSVWFNGSSSADHATISVFQVTFAGTSSAGSAHFNGVSALSFNGNSTGGSALVDTGGTGSLYIDSNTNGGITIGGLTGTGGAVHLGSNTLTVSNASTGVFAGIIDDTGNGKLVKTGGGTLILTGANTYAGGTTISLGTLQVGNGGTIGSILGDVDLGASVGTLAFNRSDDITYGGVIAGTNSGANVEKAGAGTLTLSGTSTFNGTAFVDEGTLNVTGALSTVGAVAVASGATLKGTGSIGHPSSVVQIDDGGTLNGGDGSNDLSVNGSRLHFVSGARYAATITSSSASIGGYVTQIDNLDIDIGAVLVVDGVSAVANNYQLLNWVGLRTGSFSGFSYGVGLSDFSKSVTYDDTFKHLTLTLTALPTFTWKGITAEFDTGSNWVGGAVPGNGNTAILDGNYYGTQAVHLGSATIGQNVSRSVGTLQFDTAGYSLSLTAPNGGSTTLTLTGAGVTGGNAPTISLSSSLGTASIVLNGASTLGDANVLIGNNGSVVFNHAADSSDTSVTVNAGGALVTGGNLSIGALDGQALGRVHISNADQLTIGALGNNHTYSGTIEGDAGSRFVKDGQDRQTLDGDSHLFAGTLVALGGTLQVDGNYSLAGVEVTTGTTLTGIGSVGGILVEGRLAPGSVGGIGTLHTGVINFHNDSNDYLGELAVDISAISGLHYDQIVATGAVHLEGTLTLNGITSLPAGTILRLIQAPSFDGNFDPPSITFDNPALILDTGFIPDGIGGQFYVAQVDAPHTWALNPDLAGDFLTNGNWVGGRPQLSTDPANFNASAVKVVNIGSLTGAGALVQIDRMVFNEAGYTIAVNGGTGGGGDLSILKLYNGVTDTAGTGAIFNITGQGAGNAIAQLWVQGGSLGHATVNLSNGAQLLLQGANADVSVTVNDSTFFLLSNTSLGALNGNAQGQLNLSTAAFTVGALGGLQTFAGSIIDGGGGSLHKAGTGTLVLSGNVAITGGIAVDSGTLQVDSSGFSASGVTVNANGTLTGTGTVAQTTVLSGGLLLPGVDSGSGAHTGALTVNNGLVLNNGSTLRIEMDGADSGKVIVTGTISGTPDLFGTLQIAPQGTSYGFGDSYLILDQSAASAGYNNSASLVLDTTGAPSFDPGIRVVETDYQRKIYVTFAKACLIDGICTPDAGDYVWKADAMTDRFGHATNWSSGVAPTRDTDVATFDASSIKTVKVLNSMALAGFTFGADGGDYEFDVQDTDFNLTTTLTFRGAGIVDGHTSGAAPLFQLTTAIMEFETGSSAGDATIQSVSPGTGTGAIVRFKGANAGIATLGTLNHELNEVTLTNTISGPEVTSGDHATIRALDVKVLNGSSLDHATVDVVAASPGLLFDLGFGGDGVITADETAGAIRFQDQSHAERASITLTGISATLTFDASFADNATILLNGTGAKLIFQNTAQSNAATITNTQGDVIFIGLVSGDDDTTLVNNSVLDISQAISGGPGPATIVLGSLTGTGRASVGANNLAIVTTGVDTYDGTIEDGGINNATGGSLLVQGVGTLVLNNAANNYSKTIVGVGATLQIGDCDPLQPIAGCAHKDAAIRYSNVTVNGTLVFARDDLTIVNTITGAGNIRWIENTTLTLTGAIGTNLSIERGTVQVGDFFSSANLFGGHTTAVAVGAELVFKPQDGSFMNLGTSLAGAGDIRQEGNGAVVNTLDGSFSGDVTINGGTFQVGSGDVEGNLPNANFTIASGAALSYALSHTVENPAVHGIFGTWAGDGQVRLRDNGTYVMHTAGSTLTGTVRIEDSAVLAGGAEDALAETNYVLLSSGTLALGDFNQAINSLSSSSSSSSLVLLGSNGGHMLTIGGDEDATFEGNITGNGAVNLTGAGTLRLTKSTGTGVSYLIGPDARLVLDGSNDTTVPGSISGTGTLIVQQNNGGNRTVELDGDNTGFTGDVEVGALTTLVLKSNASLQTDISNAGTVRFDSPSPSFSAITFTGSVTGTGQLVNTNQQLTLAGASYQGGISVGNGVFFDAGSNNQTVSANITGSSNWEVHGTGTVTFSGDNSGFGGSIVAIANGATLKSMQNASLQTSVVNNGTLIFDTDAGTITYAGQILHGPQVGRVVVQGASRVRFTDGTFNNDLDLEGDADFVFAGNGTLNGALSGTGHLDVAGSNSSVTTLTQDMSGFTGSIAVDSTLRVTDVHEVNADISVNGGSFVEFAPQFIALTVNGAVTENSSSSYILVSGANATTFTNEALDVGIRIDHSTLVFDFADNVTYARELSGNGTFIKKGAGVTTLTDDLLGLSATTEVEAGELHLLTSLQNGNVVVDNGAVLSSENYVARSVTVHDGGTFRLAGNSPFSITGDLTLEGGSHYDVGLGASNGAAARAVVDLAAVIDGSTLHIDGQGNTFNLGDSFVVLSTNDGVTGTFADVTYDVDFGGRLRPVLTYNASSIVLTMARAPFFWAASPGAGDWDKEQSWENGAVPDDGDDATFGASINKNPQVTSDVGIASMTFVESGYQIDVRSDALANFSQLTVTGDGVSSGGPSTAPTFLVASTDDGDQAVLRFTNTATAGNAHIETVGSGSKIIFNDNSSAGSATFSIGDNSQVVFNQSSDGGTAQVDLADNAALEFNGHSFDDFTLGGLAGTDSATVNGNTVQLIVGSANTDTTFAGVMLVLGLTKTGTGKLILTGDLNNGGATTVEDGTLLLGAGVADTLPGGALVIGSTGTLELQFLSDMDVLNAVSGDGTLRIMAGGAVSMADTFNSGFVGTVQIDSGAALIQKNLTNGWVGTARIVDEGLLRFAGSVTLADNLIEGQGRLELAAGHSVALTADNPFSGITHLEQGSTLFLGQQGSAAGLVSGDIELEDGSNVTFGRAGNYTFGNHITGTGSVSAGDGAGGGELTLTNTTDYTGTTFINSGTTLRAGAAGVFSHASVFELCDCSTLDLNGYNQTIAGLSGGGSVVLGTTDQGVNNPVFTVGTDGNGYSGVISGFGRLVVTGPAAFALGNHNTFTGTTTIDGATLFFIDGPDDTYGSVAGDIIDNGALVLQISGDTQVAGSISGSGLLHKQGGSNDVTTLFGTDSYVGDTNLSGGALRAGNANVFSTSSRFVVDGTLDLNGFDNSIGGLDGGGTVRLGGSTLTSGSLQQFNTFSGTISGGGGFTELAGGTQVFTGDYSGIGDIQADGVVSLAGSSFFDLFGHMTIGAGGVLIVASDDGLRLHGNIDGDGIFRIENGGAVVASDIAATVSTEINASTLQIGDGYTGSIAGDIALTDSSTLSLFLTSTDIIVGTITGDEAERIRVETGRLVLAQDNPFAGSIVVADGAVLQLGDGGTSGSIQGGVTGQGTLAFARSNDVLVDTDNFGVNKFEQMGPGVLRFANSFINASLKTSGGAIAFEDQTVDGAIENNSALIAGGSTVQFLSDVTGSGALNVLDGTNVFFYGQTSFEGPTTLGDHAVAFWYHGNDTINTDVTMGAGASMTFVQNGDVHGAITGGDSSGAVNIDGQYTFYAPSSYSADTNVTGTMYAGAAGVFSANSAFHLVGSLILNDFDQTIGSLASANSSDGGIDVGTATLTVGSLGTDSAYFGNIVGTTGGLTKVGSGTQILGSGLDYAGQTTIDGGKLVINGQAQNTSVQVNNGGTLGGNGSVGGSVTVASGGTLAPGSSIGTLSIGTDLVLDAGSHSVFEVDADFNGDFVSVGDSVSIAGDLKVIFADGLYHAGRYHLFQTDDGSISGTFQSLDATLGGFTVSLDYDNSNVYLLLQQLAVHWSTDPPGSPANWNDAANWDEGMAPDPTGTAVFGDSTNPNPVIDNGDTAAIGQMEFAPSDAAYTITIDHSSSLTVQGGGIEVTSDFAPVFEVGTDSTLAFHNGATAGNAEIHVADGGTVRFQDTASADSASFDIGDSGSVSFWGQATAGDVTSFEVLSAGAVSFHDASTFGDLAITLGGDSALNLGTNGTHGQLTVTADDSLITMGDAFDAGSAVITVDHGTRVVLSDEASLGTAALALVDSGSKLDISGLENSGTTLGSLSGNGQVVLGDKTLTVGALGFDDTFGGTITDQNEGGALVKTGSGRLTLTNDGNEYLGGTTILNGTLQIGNGGTGVIHFDIRNEAVLVYNMRSFFRTDGVISGAGALFQEGPGTLALAGTHTYTGATTVDGGTLQVEGDITASVSVAVNNNATLAGAGHVSSTTLTGNATLAPGEDGIGTLHIDGDLTLGGTTHFQVEFGPSVSDVAAVSGDASIAGVLDVIAIGGQYAPGQYTILTGRSVTGTFSSLTVAGPLVGLQASVVYDPTDVLLVLTRSGTLWSANPTSSDWNTGTNWESGVVPPSDQQAVFAQSTITTVNVNAATSIGGLGFDSGAPAYTINIAGTAAGDASLTVGALGVADASSNLPTLTASGTGGHTGALVFTGASTGDAILTANTGGTIVVGGALDGRGSRVILNGGGILDVQVSDVRIGSLEGDGTVALHDNVLFIGKLNTDTVFTGSITGAGGDIVKSGTGRLTLAGNNTFDDGAQLEDGGTLQIGNGGTTGNLIGDVEGHGALAFNRSDTLTFAGQIRDDITVQQIGAGTTVLTAHNTYTGGTTITAGTLQLGDGGATGSITGDVTDNGTLAFNHDNFVFFSGEISGTGGVKQIGSGLTIFEADNTYTGGTIISAGMLSLGSNGSAGSVIGTITDNAILQVDRSDVYTLTNKVTGTGSFRTAGTGTVIMTALNDYTGGTDVLVGALQLGNGGTSGSLVGNVNVGFGTTFAINRSDTIIFGPAAGGGSSNTLFGGAITGDGAFVQKGTGTTILTAANAYTGGTTISAGTLQIGDGHTFGSITGNVVDNARLVFNRSDDVYFDGTISGNGTLVKRGAGTLILTANNTLSGTTTISGGALQLGDGGDSGAVAGAIVNNGALVVDRSGSVTLGGAITGSGSLTKIGSGILALTGASTYAGGTDVQEGTLAVDGSITSGVTVAAGATLGGTGTVGSASIATDGTLNAGDGGVGTLHVTGNLTLATGAHTVAEIGPSAADAVMAGGAATIAGDLTVIGSGGAFGAGQYTLINSIGTLTGTFDTLYVTGSFGGFDVDLKYDSHNVILVLDLNGVRWKSDPVSGDWNTGDNWLIGTVPSATDKAYFGASTITSININQATTIAGIKLGAGAPAYTFNVAATATADSSLTVDGAGIGNASGNKPTFLVAGNGTHTAALTFTNSGSADAVLTANSGSTVAFTGTASGGTSQAIVNAGGTLTIAGLTNGGMTIGSIEGAGAFVLGVNTLTEGGLNTSTTVSGIISGSGGLTKIGTGTLTLTGANTYTGVTMISGGAVQIGNGGTSGSIAGDVADNALLVFNRSDAVTFAGAISGTGAVSQAGAGTTTLTANNTYTGGTLIAAGTLQIGNGGAAGAIVGDVIDNGVLVINRSGTLTLAGAISGTGTVTQAGSGTTVLAGANTYAGTTTISGGTLQVGAGGTSGSLGAGAVADNGVLAFNRSDNIVVANAISGTGSFQQNGSGMTSLTGNNTYTGGTTVSAGVLILGNGGTTGSIAGNVIDNATFAVNRSDAYIFVGAISGTGAFIQAGTGATILTGANTYAGGTLVHQGTLQLGNGGTTGSITGDVDDEGALAFNRSDSTIFTGTISGAGSVSQIGGGTTVLTAANGYTGGTTITAGTLQLGNGGTAGSILGNVTDNGTLAFNRSDAVVFDGVISGSGAVKQIGTGLTVLTASNTYTGGTTITAGTLRIGNGGTTGSITGNVADNGALEFNRSNALTFSGAISGTGGVNQIGAGVTTLSGASTYSGATNVAAGGLRAGAANAFSAASSYAVGTLLDLNSFSQAIGSLSGAGSVTLGSGNLTTGGDNSSTLFSGVISGSGALTKAGSGTFTLTGANTYAGGTTITGGTLQLGNGGTTGSILGNVVDNGTLAINHANDVLFDATISGTGALLQAGTGRTALTATNTYTGGTTINAGTLIMGNGGTVGSIVGNVVDNGSFIINRSDNITFAGAISGTGSLTKLNANTLILTGNSTYTGGTTFDGILQLGNGGTSGTIVGNIANNGLLIVNRSDSITLAGVISGAGGLNQVGTGTTFLSGVSTYSGATLVTAGILSVNGSIANSAVTVNGGQLKGNGTVGALTILGGGNLAPGNSIGTLNVVGDLVLAAGTNYNVEVNGAGQSDRVNVGGVATIAGGTVLVAAAPNDKYAQQTTYRIISTVGGVVGHFAGVTVDLPFFNVSLGYSTTAVDVILQAKQIDFSGLTLTPNEKAAADAINTGGFNTDLYKAFLNQPSNAFIPGALDALSGEVHPSIRTAMIEDSRNARTAILDRLRDANGSLADGASNARPVGQDMAMWLRVFTNWGNADTDGNAGTLGQSFSGIMVGGDVKLDTLTLGVAGGYTHESLNVKSRSSRASSGDGHIAGYAGWTGGPVSLRAGVEYAWGESTVTRTVQFPGFLNNLNDKESRHSTQIFGEAGYGMDFDHISLEPFASVAWVSADSGMFAESGGLAALTSTGGSSSVTFTDLGVRVGMDGGFLTPRASLAWQHAFGDVRPGQIVQFASTQQNFLVLGVPLDSDAIAAELGVDIALSDSAHLGLGYDGVISSRVQSHAARADFVWNF